MNKNEYKYVSAVQRPLGYLIEPWTFSVLLSESESP